MSPEDEGVPGRRATGLLLAAILLVALALRLWNLDHGLPFAFNADEDPPSFSFDLSYSYYSPAYERPGPEVRIYRLHDCDQGYGPREDGA